MGIPLNILGVYTDLYIDNQLEIITIKKMYNVWVLKGVWP